MATFSVLILTAAPPGLGNETGGGFMKIDGREAILRSAELFLNRDNVKQVQVVFLPDEAEEGKRKYGTHLGLFGVKILTGGPRWIDQIAAAAAKIDPEATHVIIHDAARPAVPYADIDALMEAAANKPIVSLATPVRNNLAEVDEGGNPLAFSPPSRFMQLLSPQSFALAAFKEMATSKKDPHASAFTLLKGSPLNVRIGGPGDANFAKAMINMLPKPKAKGMTNPFEEAQW
jgi:2-C-methyl-D-erythritol 4-phosphate cytidylyltransferase